LQLPFYIAGDAGFLQVFTLSGFLLLIIYYSKTLKELFTRGFLFISSVPLMYELVVRSEIFSVMFLAALLSVFILKSIPEDKLTSGSYFTAILFGLLLSTRLTVFIVF